MDASGGVPEPLLPPQIALQNPELVGGELFHVLAELGQILVMIDSDGDENYVPHVIPLEGGFPEPLAEEAFANGRSHLVDVDDEAEIAYFTVESREESVDDGGPRRSRDAARPRRLWQSPYGAFVAAWTPDHSRWSSMDGYTMGDVVLYEVDDAGARSMLFGTPIEERDPESSYPLSGFRAAHGTASGAGVLLTTTLYDDTGSLAFLDLSRPGEVEPVSIDGLAHDGVGELEGLDHLEGDRYSLTYNIDGCSWVYAGTFDEVRTVVLGRPRSRRRGRARRRRPARPPLRRRKRAASSRRSARRRARRSSTSCRRIRRRLSTLTRERALGARARPALGGRGRLVRVARRPARLRASLPAVTRARLRGRAAARLLRPRRPAEPGAPELRMVLDAAHPDPDARGLRGVRPERARIDGLRARLLEAGRPRLGRARPPRPRPRDDRGAAAATSASTSRAPVSSVARTAAT